MGYGKRAQGFPRITCIAHHLSAHRWAYTILAASISLFAARCWAYHSPGKALARKTPMWTSCPKQKLLIKWVVDVVEPRYNKVPLTAENFAEQQISVSQGSYISVVWTALHVFKALLVIVSHVRTKSPQNSSTNHIMLTVDTRHDKGHQHIFGCNNWLTQVAGAEALYCLPEWTSWWEQSCPGWKEVISRASIAVGILARACCKWSGH